jgi:O-antigen/teichoic acid export membrane protein
VTRVVFVCGTLGFGAVFFLKDYLIGLFGKGYEASAAVIIIILVSETIDFGVGPARQLITMSGGGRINLINSILTLTIDITASFLLIPKYGIMGAAIANAFTNVVLQIVTVVELMVIYKLSPFSKQYFIEASLFVGCILGTVFLPLPNLVKLAIYLVVLSTLYLTITLGKKERQKIKALISEKRKKKKFRVEADQEA